MATTLDVPVHQYDCFNTTRPACPGRTVFHEACIGSEPAVVDGRGFDTLSRQLAANGDGAAHVVVKMDVEGAEWDVFLTAPDETLARIDQLVVEFHGTDERRFLNAVHRLSEYFHVANLHMNNHACDPTRAPFPAWAYEVLFVAKRLDQATGAGPAPWPHALDTPNTPGAAELPGPTRALTLVRPEAHTPVNPDSFDERPASVARTAAPVHPRRHPRIGRQRLQRR